MASDDGPLPLSIKAFELPVLDTAHIDTFAWDLVTNSCIHQQKLSLITVLRGLRHAINIHLSPSTLELLSQSHDMLVKENFKFYNLKVLNLVPPPNKPPAAYDYSSVAADLLKDCPHAIAKSLLRLISLRLERVRISSYEPFSSFPNLEELVLVNCPLWSNLDGLKVIGTQLSRLTISPYRKLVLLTPKVVLFDLQGPLPLSIKAFELPVLDTAHIDTFAWDLVTNSCIHQQKLSLITVLRGLRHAINIHLSPSTLELLSQSHDMLVKENFKFDNLKVLNLVPPPNKPPAAYDYSSVAADLLKDCPQVIVKSLLR
ncbi:F-box domain, cyclin-like protein [Artemisia annua]|uniref:F-box domain, cyclin-like protein n=1 Tax=Artemisia annua TaxID=35608 RepID=A0A2U1N7N5_ARTAN|nr:F-box domain, cyclin-like protein [Artemisia annua]